MIKGWGFKIDYDANILADEWAVALYADGGPVARLYAAYQSVVAARFPEWKPDTAADIVQGLTTVTLEDLRQFLSLAGLDLSEALAIALTDWNSVDESVTTAAETMWASYGAAAKVADPASIRLGSLPFCNDATRVALLKKAKASLSRHKRNKAKYK